MLYSDTFSKRGMPNDSKRLLLVEVSGLETNTKILIDLEAVSNVMFATICLNLDFYLHGTRRIVRTVDGSEVRVFGELEQVSIMFDGMTKALTLLVVKDFVFARIIVLPALMIMHVPLAFGKGNRQFPDWNRSGHSRTLVRQEEPKTNFKQIIGFKRRETY